jgi:hypothetical protein
MRLTLTLVPLHAGCHQNNVSIELDYVTVPDGTTYSKCTSLKEPITCGKCEYRVFYRVQCPLMRGQTSPVPTTATSSTAAASELYTGLHSSWWKQPRMGTVSSILVDLNMFECFRMTACCFVANGPALGIPGVPRSAVDRAFAGLFFTCTPLFTIVALAYAGTPQDKTGEEEKKQNCVHPT